MRDRIGVLEKTDNYLMIGLTVFLASTLLLLFGYRQIRLENSTTETIQCEVVDKYYVYSSSYPYGKSYDYYIVVSFEHAEIKDSESEIQISADCFESLRVGDKVFCKVVFDTEGIIEIEALD